MSPLQFPASKTVRDIRRGPDSRISARSRVASASDGHLVGVEPEPRQRLHQLLFLIREVREEGVAQVIDSTLDGIMVLRSVHVLNERPVDLLDRVMNNQVLLGQ